MEILNQFFHGVKGLVLANVILVAQVQAGFAVCVPGFGVRHKSKRIRSVPVRVESRIISDYVAQNTRSGTAK